MATLTVEGKQFDMNDLSDEAKSHAHSVNFCDNKINQLETEIRALKMARNGYIQQLLSALPNAEKKPAVKRATTRKSDSKSTNSTNKPAASRKRSTAATAKKTTSPIRSRKKVEVKAADGVTE